VRRLFDFGDAYAIAAFAAIAGRTAARGAIAVRARAAVADDRNGMRMVDGRLGEGVLRFEAPAQCGRDRNGHHFLRGSAPKLQHENSVSRWLSHEVVCDESGRSNIRFKFDGGPLPAFFGRDAIQPQRERPANPGETGDTVRLGSSDNFDNLEGSN